MLWTIGLGLLILWALGLVVHYTLGGILHILFALAIVVFLTALFRRRRRAA